MASYAALIGRRVEVYRNLHRGCYSVRDASTRRVVLHVSELRLVDVEFHVSRAGRARARAERRRNVHATLRGTLARAQAPRGWPPATYSPWSDCPGFHLTDSTAPLATARGAWLDTTGLRVCSPTPA